MVKLDNVTEGVLDVINDNKFSQTGAFNLRENGTSICHFAIRRFLSIAVFWRKIFMIAAFVHLLILMNIFQPANLELIADEFIQLLC